MDQDVERLRMELDLVRNERYLGRLLVDLQEALRRAALPSGRAEAALEELARDVDIADALGSRTAAEVSAAGQLLTAPEAAKLLRTSTKAVYALVERGQIPGVRRMGRRLLFDARALEEWSRGRVTGKGLRSRQGGLQ